MGRKLNVSMSQDLLVTIFEGAKQLCPRESILFLMGKRLRFNQKKFEQMIFARLC